ncbi:MAG: response regulator [Candidatus Omnitrophica bacterium]|nr:response regulator [Candidatus Omnitrophota bacterium]
MKPLAQSAKKILIVDDNAEIRSALKEAFAENNFIVSTLASGLELLGYLRKGKQPDVLILDIIMPERTGIDVLSSVRSVWPMVKIAIHSGHGEYRHSIPPHFIDLFLEKPVPVDEIIEKIRGLF